MKKITFVLASIVFIIYFISNASGEDTPGVVETSLVSIQKICEQMESANKLSGRKRDSKVAVRLEAAMATGREIDKKLGITGPKALGTVKSVAAGVTKLTKGIRSSTWHEIVVAGLDIISSLTALVDNKYFEIATSFLKILSTVFGIVGSSTGGSESTEGMMKRVIEKALLENKSDKLRAQFFGVKRLYASLSNSVRAFRDANTTIHDGVVNEVYTLAFSGVELFGIIESKLEHWCEIGDSNSYAEDKKSELKEKANRCLEFLNLYADCSIIRQMLLADMAALLVQLNREDTAKSLLMLLRQEQESDKNIFRFLAEPINYRTQRYVTALFYSGIEKYPTLSAYLIALNRVYDLEPPSAKRTSEVVQVTKKPFIPPSVMVCQGLALSGDCRSQQENKEINSFDKWNGNINSVYISAGKELFGFETENREGKRFGPYYGPAVFGDISVSETVKFKSATIKASTKNAANLLRICESNALDVNSRCSMLDYGDYRNLQAPASSSWDNRIRSMSIPSGMMVTGWANSDFGGNKYGPFFGPQTIAIVCGAGTWTSMKVEKATTNSNDMIQICRGEGLTDYCDHIDEMPAALNEEKKFDRTSSEKNLHGCLFNNKNRMKSMRIPGGFIVDAFTGYEYQGQIFGPYKGPVTINYLDGSISDDDYIKSIRIKKLY